MSCTVNPKITGGIKNVPSKLHSELESKFPDSNFAHPETGKSTSSIYASLIGPNSEYKKQLGEDWETKEGNDKLSSLGQGILGENNEPKLYVDKIGVAYFKLKNGKRYIINQKKISITERLGLVSSLTAAYIENPNVSLKDFILNSMIANSRQLRKNIADLSETSDSKKELLQSGSLEKKEATEVMNQWRAIKRAHLKALDHHKFIATAIQDDSMRRSIEEEMKSALKESGTNYIEDVFDKENADTSTMDYGFLLSSDQISSQKGMPSVIRSLINGINVEKRVYLGEEMNSEVEMLESMPLLKKVENSSMVFSKIEKELSGIIAPRIDIDPLAVANMSPEELAIEEKRHDIFEIMLNKLKVSQEENDDYVLKQVIEKLEYLIESQKSPQDKENIKTKFFLAFNKSKVSNKMFSLNERTREGDTSTKILNINSIDVSNDENKHKEIGSELVINMFNSFEGRDEEALIKSLTGNLQFRGNFKNYLSKRYGMNLQDKTIDQLMAENARKGISNKQFIDNLSSLISIVPGADAVDVVKKEGKGTIRLASVYKNLGMADRAAVTEALSFNKGNYSEIGSIARLEAKNKPTDGESSIVVGNTKRWLYSLMSKYDLDVARWKSGDKSQLKDLEGTGNEIVEYLLANDVPGEIRTKTSDLRIKGISMKNNTELRKKLDTNPTMFDQLSLEDLVHLVYSELYESKKEIYQNNDSLSDAGNNRDFETKIATKDSNNTVVILTNVDKTRTPSISGLNTGDSSVVMNGDSVQSAGLINISRMRDMFYGEINKIKKVNLKIAEYKGQETPTQKRDFAAKHLIPGWHFSVSKVKIGVDKNGEDIMQEKDYFDPKNEITDDEFSAGKAKQFGFLNEFYLDNKLVIQSRYLTEVDAKRIEPTELFDLDKELDRYLVDILNKEVGNFNSLYSLKNDIGFGDSKTEDRLLLDAQTNLPVDGSAAQKAANLSANYMFKSISMFSLFNGEVGMYGQKGARFAMTDALKRTSAPGADGKYTRNSKIELAYYMPYGKKNVYDKDGKLNKDAIPYIKGAKTIVATVKDQEYADSFYSPQINKVLRNMGRKAVKDLKLEGTVADGSTMAHPDFLFNYYGRVYGNSDADIATHNELMDPNTVLKKKHFLFLKKIAGSQQAAKLQSFSQSKVNGTSLNFFLKTSVMPLYPALTAGFPIDNLRASMVSQGVDLVAMDSAVKGSKPLSTTIHGANSSDNKLGSLLDEKEIQLNPFQINTEDIKVQVELSAKGDKESLAGNQHMKNILANMDLTSPDKVYNFRGESLTASEMYDVYNDSVKEVIQDQLKTFLNKIENGNKIDDTVLRQLIIDQLDDADYDLKELLKDPFNPIEIVPGLGNKAFSVISSYLLKKVGKPATNGMAAIQVANYGFAESGVDKKNVLMLKDVSDLKPPRPTTISDYLGKLTGEALIRATEAINGSVEEYNLLNKTPFDVENDPLYFFVNEEGITEVSLTQKEQFRARIEKGQIMIPFNSLFKKSGMSWNSFKEFMADKDNYDPRVLEKVLGYRIPNQSISSNDSFEIVGILPPSAGDSAIIYHEITAKTGSDFDIDKMVLMLPNFKAETAFVIDEEISHQNRKILRDIKDSKTFNNYFQTGEYTSVNSFIRTLMTGANTDFSKLIAEGAKTYIENGKPNVDKMMMFFVNNRDSLEKAIKNDDSTAVLNGKAIPHTVADVLEDFYLSMEEMQDDIDQELSVHKIPNNARQIVTRFDYIDDDSKKGLQNKMIEAMTAVLESSATFDDLISPLDGTYIKDKIQEVNYIYSLTKNADPEASIAAYNNLDEEAQEKAVQTYIKEKKLSVMESMTLYNLAKIRADMLMAKGLTATMANHMSDIPFGQIKKAFLRYNIGLGDGSLARTSVIGKEKDFDFKITKMVSYLMNASVDASKDNYIIEGNYNRYTSGAAMLLIRLGVDPMDVSKIIMHPDIVSLAKEKIASTSKTVTINAAHSQANLDKMSVIVADKLNRGMPIIPDNFIALSYKDKVGVKVKAAKGEIEVQMTRADVLGFWNILVSMAKDMNDDIAVSKPETTGIGKNIAEAQGILNRAKIMRGNSVAYHNKQGNIVAGAKVKENGFHENDLAKRTKNEQGTYLESIYDTVINFSNEITGDMFLERTQGYYNLTNEIMQQMGNHFETNEENIKKIHNSMYPFMLTKLFTKGSDGITVPHEITNLNEETSEYLLEQFPSELLALKNSEEYINDEFLKELYIDAATGFISFKNTSNYTDNVKKSIGEAMASLYENQDTREIAKNLVKYSFLTTGFKPSSYGYVDYLPKQYFVDSGYGVAIKNLIERLNGSGSIPSKSLVSEAIIFMATNRPNDDQFFADIREKSVPIKSGEIVKDSYLLGRLNMRGQEKENDRFKFFAHTKNKMGHKYFMLTNVVTVPSKEGDVSYPTYTQINVMQHIDEKFSAKMKATKVEDLSKKQKSLLNAEERNSRLVLFNSNLNKQEKLIVNYEKVGGQNLFLKDLSKELAFKNEEIKFNLNFSEASKLKDTEPALNSASIELKKMTKAVEDYKSKVKEGVLKNNESDRKEMSDLLISLANGNIEDLAKANALLTNKCN